MIQPAIKIFHNIQVPEESDAVYRTQFTAAIPAETVLLAGAISSITCTLSRADGEPINGRDAQNVNGANGGSLDVNGWFTLLLESADHEILQASNGKEERVLTISVTYNRTGAPNPGIINHEVRYWVYDLLHISA